HDSAIVLKASCSASVIRNRHISQYQSKYCETKNHDQERLGIGRPDKSRISISSQRRAFRSWPRNSNLSPRRSGFTDAKIGSQWGRPCGLAAAVRNAHQNCYEEDPDLRMRGLLSRQGRDRSGAELTTALSLVIQKFLSRSWNGLTK